MTLRMIVGLGNPGLKYANNRHNVGAWFLNELVAKYSVTLRDDTKFASQVAKLTLDDQTRWLMIPQTFMNESGRAVRSLAQFYKIPPEDILVAHDELDFPAGTVRFKVGGGHGGHNGLRDIERCLGSRDFCRLRIGIGHPGHKDRVTPYVLGDPSPDDRSKILEAIDASLVAMPELFAGDIEGVFRCLHQP